jgi:hypothetical protein
MKLDDTQKNSGLWKEIEAELNTRLQSLREQNDSDRQHDESAKLRGRIAEIKAILAWAQDDPEFIE